MNFGGESYSTDLKIRMSDFIMHFCRYIIYRDCSSA